MAKVRFCFGGLLPCTSHTQLSSASSHKVPELLHILHAGWPGPLGDRHIWTPSHCQCGRETSCCLRIQHLWAPKSCLLPSRLETKALPASSGEELPGAGAGVLLTSTGPHPIPSPGAAQVLPHRSTPACPAAKDRTLLLGILLPQPPDHWDLKACTTVPR